MTTFFENIPPIPFVGQNSKTLLGYQYYQPKHKILGKTMEEHLRLAVCYWHTFCWAGQDVFGEPVFDHPWLKETDPLKRAELKVQAAFAFIEKLGLKFFTFHDRDIAPMGKTIQATQKNLSHIAEKIAREMQRTNIQLLWGTANLFSEKRYLAGAATNPDPEIFAYAITQVKAALDVTHQLNGANYVLWGGREGYETLLNTNLKQELDQLGRFLSLLVDYKHKIGFKGTFLIEPKPHEPTKHQYDYDSATVFAFLQKYGLEKEFKVNIEANHATLAGHTFDHEIAYAYAHDIFGSIDANQGDPQLGWDTDQFPTNLHDFVPAMYVFLKNGGFTTGGFNFDAKLRRQSIAADDLFYAHISGIDTLAHALIIAADWLEKGALVEFVKERYAGWQTSLGKDILQGKMSLEQIANYTQEKALDPQPVSGRQEMLEILAR